MRDRNSGSGFVVVGPAAIFVLVGALLLSTGRTAYPQLHTVLDTAAWLLSCMLAISLWDLGSRTNQPILTWLGLSFAVTSLLELVHVASTVEWSGQIASFVQLHDWLRPSTWPPAAYVLPIGAVCAIWLARDTFRQALTMTSILLLLGTALLTLFYFLPRYSAPDSLGISRPTLLPVPPLWALVGLVCWYQRGLNRIYSALAGVAALLCLAHIAMLYSRAPHDAPAMVAHFGKLCGYLTLQLAMMRLASWDAFERARSEEALVHNNATLEDRVRLRTVELQGANRDLQFEVATRREAELALADSHLRTRAIFETALDGVTTMDHLGQIAEFNSAAEHIFGYDRDTVIGQPLAEKIIPVELREAHQRGLARYLDSQHTEVLGKRIELTGVRADGSTVPIELSINRMPGAGPPLFAAYVRDITERRTAIAAIQESQARFQTLTESLPHLVWTCLPNLQCDFLSRQWLEYTGRPESEQLGYGWADAVHPEDRERTQARWSEAGAKGVAFDTEFRIRRNDGEYRWFTTRAIPFRNAAGQIAKWFGSNTDCDDLKRSEEKLRTQLGRMNLLDQTTRAIGNRQDLPSIFRVVLSSLEDHLPVDFGCMCLCEPQQAALTVTCVGPLSQALMATMNLTEQTQIEIDDNGLGRCMRGKLVYEPDIVGSSFDFPARLARGGMGSVVIAPLIVESRVFGVMVAARRGVASFSSAECEFLRQLSEHVALAAHQAQLYVSLQNAFTELRQTQHAVMQNERLRAVGEMASGIAHDINNALSPAALYVQSLLERDTSLNRGARSDLAVIQRSIDDVARTIARMREFSRPREQSLALAPVNLNEVLQQVADVTRARWSDMPQQHGIVVRMDRDFTAALPDVTGAESEIRDAFTNLVLNAVDALPEGGAITLRSRVVPRVDLLGGRSGPTQVQIEVCDTGVGMSEATRSRCLEPFFSTKGERGTGLGLAMVYGMVQRHGATLDVLSEIGSGTTMRITFPLGQVSTRLPRGTPQSLDPLRILFVDDDLLLLQSLQATFERDGHTVLVANGGQSGIDTFAAAVKDGRHFDVVVSDLGMPYVDGRTVAAAIKELSSVTPVILLTGWGHRLIAEHDIPEHVDRVLSKPPNLVALRAAIAEVIHAAAPRSPEQLAS